MWLSGNGIGSNTPLPGILGEGGALANTQVTAVNGNTITVSYVPAGFGGANQGTLGDVPAGTTLTFSIPPENTNFLEAATGGVNSATNNPFTFAYEFGQSKTTEQTATLAPRSTVPPFQVPQKHMRPTRTSCPISNRSPRQRQRPDTPAM